MIDWEEGTIHCPCKDCDQEKNELRRYNSVAIGRMQAIAEEFLEWLQKVWENNCEDIEAKILQDVNNIDFYRGFEYQTSRSREVFKGICKRNGVKLEE